MPNSSRDRWSECQSSRVDPSFLWRDPRESSIDFDWRWLPDRAAPHSTPRIRRAYVFFPCRGRFLSRPMNRSLRPPDWLEGRQVGFRDVTQVSIGMAVAMESLRGVHRASHGDGARSGLNATDRAQPGCLFCHLCSAIRSARLSSDAWSACRVDRVPVRHGDSVRAGESDSATSSQDIRSIVGPSSPPRSPRRTGPDDTAS